MDDLFADETEATATPKAAGLGEGALAAPWPVLIVDDDEEVHTMTRLVLSRMRYKDRPLELLTARSGAQAAEVLARRPDIAVAVLDIVMETDDAGLVLARRIREEFRYEDVRIVLRTGQPGQAPVRTVILDYDINDYKAKTELTADAFFITMITALRSYDNIRSARLAEGASQLKSAFLATMSHEIRNPMHAVLANLELLTRTPLSVDQADMLGAANEAADTLLRIIDDILDFSKIEAGKMDIDRHPLSLGAVVESVVESLAGQARAKGLCLRVHVDPALPPSVAGDPVRLRQVLYNLVGNALKFTREGSVTVSATALAPDVSLLAPDVSLLAPDASLLAPESGSAAAPDAPPPAPDDWVYLRVAVTDTGIGIEPEAQAALFQPFTQAERSTTRRFGGTGLGLSISRRLLELMRGRIGVHSVPGQGSTFWFELALERLPDMAAGPLPPRLDGRRIGLAIADDGVRDTVRRYLECAGAEVVPPQSGGDALVMTLGAGAPSDWGLRPTVVLAPSDSGLPTPLPVTARQVALPLRRAALLAAVRALIDGRPPETRPLRGAPGAGGAPARAPVRAPDRSVAMSRGLLVLVAEDQPVNQMVIRRQLDLLGVACDIVDDGAQALNAWMRGGYGLVLTDCNMPEMDGFELTAAIRAGEAATGRRTPVIALTANAVAGESQRCLNAGMDGFLSKPVNLAQLEGCVATWLPAALELGRGPAGPAAGPAAGPGQPVLDMAFLEELLGDQGAEQQVFLRDFLAAARPLAARLDALLAAGDGPGARAAAHALAGTAKSAGAVELGALADRVEAALAPEVLAVAPSPAAALNQARQAAASVGPALFRVEDKISLL